MTTHAIDIHCHMVPQDFPPYAGRHSDVHWPQMCASHDCHHRNVMIGNKLFRTVSDECWDVDRRAEAMKLSGVTRQVLSPMPELLSYWAEPEDALDLARYVNGIIAEMTVRRPERFSGLGTVPLQNPDLAAKELQRLMNEGCLKGVEIGSNVNGVPIGDSRFEAFFAAAQELDASILVHALRPAAGADRLIGPPVLANVVAFPCETSFAIVSLITGGMFRRHPRLRLAFSHGGGAFGLVLPRVLAALRAVQELRGLADDPLGQARRFYYDTLVFDTRTLRFLVDQFGVTQLCIGTDYPFTGHESAPVAAVQALELDSPERDLLLYGNALRFLGQGSAAPGISAAG